MRGFLVYVAEVALFYVGCALIWAVTTARKLADRERAARAAGYGYFFKGRNER